MACAFDVGVFGCAQGGRVSLVFTGSRDYFCSGGRVRQQIRVFLIVFGIFFFLSVSLILFLFFLFFFFTAFNLFSIHTSDVLNSNLIYETGFLMSLL